MAIPSFAQKPGFWIIAVVIGLYGYAYFDKESSDQMLAKPTPSPTTKASSPDRVPDWQVISYAERQVQERLRDPDSASFRDVKVSYRLGHPTVCGYVNSKNGFGGMGGFQRFISGGITALEEDMEAGAMDETWQKVC